jgi:hypothetical protein
MKKVICYLPLLLFFTGKKINLSKMKCFAFFISALTLLASCNSNSSSGSDSYPQKAMSAEKIERSKATNFLKADEICMGNFFGDTINIHGVIKNNSTNTSYRDAVVKITYYSYTKTELGSKEYAIHEVFPADSEVRVELKVDYHKDVKTIGWDVVQATAN